MGEAMLGESKPLLPPSSPPLASCTWYQGISFPHLCGYIPLPKPENHYTAAKSIVWNFSRLRNFSFMFSMHDSKSESRKITGREAMCRKTPS